MSCQNRIFSLVTPVEEMFFTPFSARAMASTSFCLQADFEKLNADVAFGTGGPIPCVNVVGDNTRRHVVFEKKRILHQQFGSARVKKKVMFFLARIRFITVVSKKEQ